jgi:hypothetical protein
MNYALSEKISQKTCNCLASLAGLISGQLAAGIFLRPAIKSISLEVWKISYRKNWHQ